jgi:hypothetical protein
VKGDTEIVCLDVCVISLVENPSLLLPSPSSCIKRVSKLDILSEWLSSFINFFLRVSSDSQAEKEELKIGLGGGKGSYWHSNKLRPK